MNHYNVGDCLVCKTGVVKIVGKFSKKVYEVVKYGRNFLSYDIRVTVPISLINTLKNVNQK